VVSSFPQSPPPPHLYSLSLHDPLPIYDRGPGSGRRISQMVAAQQDLRIVGMPLAAAEHQPDHRLRRLALGHRRELGLVEPADERSEEHTSELQSLTNLVCRLLLEKNTL